MKRVSAIYVGRAKSKHSVGCRKWDNNGAGGLIVAIVLDGRGCKTDRHGQAVFARGSNPSRHRLYGDYRVRFNARLIDWQEHPSQHHPLGIRSIYGRDSPQDRHGGKNRLRFRELAEWTVNRKRHLAGFASCLP